MGRRALRGRLGQNLVVLRTIAPQLSQTRVRLLHHVAQRARLSPSRHRERHSCACARVVRICSIDKLIFLSLNVLIVWTARNNVSDRQNLS